MAGPGGLEVGYADDGADSRVEMTVNGKSRTYRVDPFSPVDGVPQVLVEETEGEAVRYPVGYFNNKGQVYKPNQEEIP